MVKKNNHTTYNVWLLFALSACLLAGGWLMKSFPLLIFFAYAPLFALSDQAKDKESPWNHLELILLALTISTICASFFNSSDIIYNIGQAIILTLAFIGYTFVYQNLGNRVGKFTILFFWIGLEYLMLKLPWREEFHFLSDALVIQSNWWKWNFEIGYLSNSLWILIVNLSVYFAVFKSRRVNWPILILTILLIGIPIGYSYFMLEGNGIDRVEMMNLYQGMRVKEDNYSNRGELIARTAAWVSALILLLSFVKNKTNKK